MKRRWFRGMWLQLQRRKHAICRPYRTWQGRNILDGLIALEVTVVMPRINIPPMTRGLLAVIFILSLLNVTLRYRKWTAYMVSPTTSDEPISRGPYNYLSDPMLAVPFLVLIPTIGNLRYPWTIFTAAVVENNLASLIISGAVVWFGGRYLERSWGGTEFAKFVLFVTMLPNFGAFFIYVLWHAMVGTPEHPRPIQGLVALEAGFLVALKQLVPEHTVSLFSNNIRIRIKHFPALFTLANIISGPLLGTWTALWLSSLGFLTSWIYLRFFRLSEAGAEGEGIVIKGDGSDTFAFVAFFPEPLHPFLTPLSDGAYDVLVKAGVPFVAVTSTSGDVEAGQGSLRGSEREIGAGEMSRARLAEAERRRTLALIALDERLSAAARSNEAGTSQASTDPGPDHGLADARTEDDGSNTVGQA